MPREREEWTKVDRCIWFCPQRKAAGNACFKADVNRGGQRKQEIFRSLARARKFRDGEELSIEETGLLSSKAKLKNVTVEDAIDAFINEVILEFEPNWTAEMGFELRSIVQDERIRAAYQGRKPKFTNIAEIKPEHLPARRTDYRNLKLFVAEERGLCDKPVYQVNGKDVLAYARRRIARRYYGPRGLWFKEELNEEKYYTPTKKTVARDIATLQMVFEHLKLEYTDYVNPWRTDILKRIDAPVSRRKQERLEEGELSKLLDACGRLLKLNKYYLPAAIFLAVETGMRMSEILNLRAEDVDFEKAKIKVRKSKTDKKQDVPGRTIPLTFFVEAAIKALYVHLELRTGKNPSGEDWVINITYYALDNAFKEVRRIAKLTTKDMEDNRSQVSFNRLRHEAQNKFKKVLLWHEAEAIMGHALPGSGGGYSHLNAQDLKEIKLKLDKHSLGLDKDATEEELIAVKERLLGKQIDAKTRRTGELEWSEDEGGMYWLDFIRRLAKVPVTPMKKTFESNVVKIEV